MTALGVVGQFVFLQVLLSGRHVDALGALVAAVLLLKVLHVGVGTLEVQVALETSRNKNRLNRYLNFKSLLKHNFFLRKKNGKHVGIDRPSIDEWLT